MFVRLMGLGEHAGAVLEQEIAPSAEIEVHCAARLRHSSHMYNTVVLLVPEIGDENYGALIHAKSNRLHGRPSYRASA